MSSDAFKRVPPHNAEAEMACIGSMLISNQAVNTVVQELKESDFYDARNQMIFRAVLDLQQKGISVDIVSVAERLDAVGALQKVGGTAYLSQIAENVPAAANVGFYTNMVLGRSILRSLIDASLHIIDNVYESQMDVEKTMESAERTIFDITQRGLGSDYFEIRTAIADTLKGIERRSKSDHLYTGIPTGFREFDEMTSGLQNGDLIVIAARPSMGKTALAMNMAVNIAETNPEMGILVFSLEMSYQQLALRMLSSESRLPNEKFRSGKLSVPDWDLLIRAAGKLSQMNIIIDETPAIPVNLLRSKSRRLYHEKKLGLIVVDHMQLITGEDSYRPSTNRVQEVAFISRSLKALAKELSIPVVVLSQLSRGVENREDKEPKLSDLRDSGSIEQDADIVCFLYRDEYYRKEKSTKPGVADLIIEKHRNGPIGKVELKFFKEFVRFENLDKTYANYQPSGDSVADY